MKPFQLERYFAKHEFSAKFLLSSSDCESMSIADLLDLEPAAHSRLERTWLGYTQEPGSPELRERIASLYETIAPDDVLVFSGAQEAIYAFARTAFTAHSRVVVQIPAYQSLFQIAEEIGAEVLRWTCREDDAWRPPFEDLDAWSSQPLDAIIINTPHNPTGYHLSAAEYDATAAAAERSGAVLFCDEVYRLLEYGAPRLPAACDLSERFVSLGVLSKSFGLAGLRIGWIATRNRTVREAMGAYKDYLTICASAPSEVLSAIALEHAQQILDRTRSITERNNELFDQFCRQPGYASWHRPAAGPIAFARLDGRFSSAQDLCDWAVERYGVMMLPSTKYDFGDRHIRVGLGRANFPQALAQAQTAMDAFAATSAARAR